MSDVITGRKPERRRSRALALGLVAAFVVLTVGAGSAQAGVKHKNGSFSGATKQEAVASGFRGISLQVGKKRVTLTAEPVVAFGLCVSTPVFTLDGNPTVSINGKGVFSFSQTYYGDKIDKIKGRFTSTTEIEGTATYFFGTTDMCSEGKTTTKFSAGRGGKSKKK